jgi:hypothetical protein
MKSPNLKYLFLVGISVAAIYLLLRKKTKTEQTDIYLNLVGKGDSNERIVCGRCRWSWKVKDGGDDLYMCHRCGCNNSPNKAYSNLTGEDPSIILKEWKYCFDNKLLDKIVKLYSSKAILVSTFDAILEGHEKIRDYFKGLFDKENLKVEFLEKPHVGKVGELTIFTGTYEFSFVEDGELKKVKARYSILCQRIKGRFRIIKQHSSAFAK